MPEEKLVIFSCDDLTIDTLDYYSKELVEDYARGSNWNIVDILEFCGFVYVIVN